jgi:hypothetical protein
MRISNKILLQLSLIPKVRWAEWANRYILVASETGTLQFASYFQENSWIKTGQELFYIIPKATHLFCRADCIPTEFWQIKARSTGEYCT